MGGKSKKKEVVNVSHYSVVGVRERTNENYDELHKR